MTSHTMADGPCDDCEMVYANGTFYIECPNLRAD